MNYIEILKQFVHSEPMPSRTSKESLVSILWAIDWVHIHLESGRADWRRPAEDDVDALKDDILPGAWRLLDRCPTPRPIDEGDFATAWRRIGARIEARGHAEAGDTLDLLALALSLLPEEESNGWLDVVHAVRGSPPPAT